MPTTTVLDLVCSYKMMEKSPQKTLLGHFLKAKGFLKIYTQYAMFQFSVEHKECSSSKSRMEKVLYREIEYSIFQKLDTAMNQAKYITNISGIRRRKIQKFKRLVDC
jgi:hypothetical protein